MIKMLTKHGNSLALLIEKPILDLLGADSETPFELTTDGQSLVLTPIKNANRSKIPGASLDKVSSKYARLLKKPAK